MRNYYKETKKKPFTWLIGNTKVERLTAIGGLLLAGMVYGFVLLNILVGLV